MDRGRRHWPGRGGGTTQRRRSFSRNGDLATAIITSLDQPGQDRAPCVGWMRPRRPPTLELAQAASCVTFLCRRPPPRGACSAELPPRCRALSAHHSRGAPSWKSSYRTTRAWREPSADSSGRCNAPVSTRNSGSAGSTRSPAPGANGGVKRPSVANGGGNAGPGARPTHRQQTGGLPRLNSRAARPSGSPRAGWSWSGCLRGRPSCRPGSPACDGLRRRPRA